MHPLKTRVSIFGTALLVGFAALGFSRPARASATFPPEVQKALEAEFGKAFCTPQCTFCHMTNAGGAGTLNPFALNVRSKVGLNAGLAVRIAPALTTYFQMYATTIDSDGDGTNDREAIVAGLQPGGNGVICGDIEYGCGASVASAKPPVDGLGLFSAGLAAVGLAVLRRRQRAR